AGHARHPEGRLSQDRLAAGRGAAARPPSPLRRRPRRRPRPTLHRRHRRLRPQRTGPDRPVPFRRPHRPKRNEKRLTAKPPRRGDGDRGRITKDTKTTKITMIAKRAYGDGFKSFGVSCRFALGGLGGLGVVSRSRSGVAPVDDLLINGNVLVVMAREVLMLLN